MRGIQTFRDHYQPGKLTLNAVLWDPRVWEEEQEEKKRKAEEERRKVEENKRSMQRKLQFRKVGERE